MYFETQFFRTKQTGLCVLSAQIQTAGWQEGIYLVRVNYNGEILNGKLVVQGQCSVKPDRFFEKLPGLNKTDYIILAGLHISLH